MKKYVLFLIIFIIASVSFAEVPADLLARAQSGDQVAQNEIGVLYYEGNGVPQNFKKAYNWFLAAAEKGHDVVL